MIYILLWNNQDLNYHRVNLRSIIFGRYIDLYIVISSIDNHHYVTNSNLEFWLNQSCCYKRVQLFRVYSLLTGQTYTEVYITFTDVIGNWWISETSPPTILSSGGKSPIRKPFVLIAPFLDQINTILFCSRIQFCFPDQCASTWIHFASIRILISGELWSMPT